MDPNKIFNLFNSDSEGRESIDEIKIELKELEDNPKSKIGMFTKLILNYHIFHSKLAEFLKEEEPTYNIETTKTASEFIIYNRAWFYLSQVDYFKKDHILAILDFNPKLLDKALEDALIYFQDGEEYLKCAHIFNIQQILRKVESN